jgi:hypothetical protein
MSKVNARREQLEEELVASQTYITSGYDQESAVDFDSLFTKKGISNQQSKIVSVLFVENKNQILTIDCDFLMRVWSVQTKKQVTALLLRSG